MFRQCVLAQFNKLPSKLSKAPNLNTLLKGKQANVSKIPSLISPRLSKKILEKSKYFKKNQIFLSNSQPKKPFYAQASKSNVNDIIKIKNAFLKFFSNKVSEIHEVMNKSSQKSRPKLNITTKEPLRKQVIIPMGSNKSERVMVKANTYISNINRLLKRVKSNISMDFIWSNNKELIITFNKVAATYNLNIIEKYMKNLNDIDHSDTISSRFP